MKTQTASMKTLDWIERYGSIDDYSILDGSKSEELRDPKTASDNYLGIFKNEKIQIENAYFFAKLKDIKITCFGDGINGSSFRTRNGVYLEDIAPYWNDSLYRDCISYTLRNYFSAFYTGNKWGGYNYFHFIFNCLPKIILYKRNLYKEQDVFIHNSIKKNFVRDFFSLLNISVDDIICLDDYPTLLVPNLKVISPIGYGVNGSKRSCRLIREEFKKYFSEPNGRRIYITREKSNGRRILNEMELLEILVPLGFEIWDCSLLTVGEQILLFSQSEAVISAHGAGLSNLVWCPEKTKVLELFSPNYIGLCYWLIADSCNLDYYFQVGEGKTKGYWSDGLSDIQVDTEKFKKTLELMGFI